jgi:hypothetical protein
MELEGADAVRPGIEAGRGGAGGAHCGGGVDAVVFVADESAAACGGERLGGVHPVVRDEHGKCGRQRCGSAASRRAWELAARRHEGDTATDELFLFGLGNTRRRFRQYERTCGSPIC